MNESLSAQRTQRTLKKMLIKEKTFVTFAFKFLGLPG